MSVNFNQTTAAFENDADVISVVATLTNARSTGQQPLISASDAENHLVSTLDGLFARAINTFFGSSTTAQYNCSQPQYNRTTVSQGSITLYSYSLNDTGAAVSGGGTFSITVQDVTVKEELTFDNVSIDYLGDISGMANSSAYIDDVFQGSGSSSFSETLDGNNLSIKFPDEQGRDMGLGITCDVTGATIEVEGLFAP